MRLSVSSSMSNIFYMVVGNDDDRPRIIHPPCGRDKCGDVLVL